MLWDTPTPDWHSSWGHTTKTNDLLDEMSKFAISWKVKVSRISFLATQKWHKQIIEDQLSNNKQYQNDFLMV